MGAWQWAGLALVVIAAVGVTVVIAGAYLLGRTVVQAVRMVWCDTEL